jgi:uncharacterized protein with GYD domain
MKKDLFFVTGDRFRLQCLLWVIDGHCRMSGPCPVHPSEQTSLNLRDTHVRVEIKHLYLTSGESDLVVFVEAPSGDNVAKFALAVSSLGNVRTRTVRAWSADEYRKLISELP